MSLTKKAFVLQHSPDYQGDGHPWHWLQGNTLDELARTTAHASEAEALEHLAAHLRALADQKRTAAAR